MLAYSFELVLSDRSSRRVNCLSQRSRTLCNISGYTHILLNPREVMFFQDEVSKLVKYVKELHVFNFSATHIACLPQHYHN